MKLRFLYAIAFLVIIGVVVASYFVFNKTFIGTFDALVASGTLMLALATLWVFRNSVEENKRLRKEDREEYERLRKEDREENERLRKEDRQRSLEREILNKIDDWTRQVHDFMASSEFPRNVEQTWEITKLIFLYANSSFDVKRYMIFNPTVESNLDRHFNKVVDSLGKYRVSIEDARRQVIKYADDMSFDEEQLKVFEEKWRAVYSASIDLSIEIAKLKTDMKL